MLKVKFKFFLVVILVLIILIIDKSVAISHIDEFPLLGKVIFIDAGHGGRDPGVVYGNVYEKDINLEISKLLEEKLSLKGATVFLTRDSDIDHSSIYDAHKKRGDLYRRIKMIDDNYLKADIYLSIHINWYKDSYYKGAEVLYYDGNKFNKVLASSIQEGLKINTSTNREITTTNLYMYKYINTPGVLIECGFLSNYQERKLLQDKAYQVILANSITYGVIEYFNNI